MPLISIWTAQPDAVNEMTIEQVVSAAGDGVLKDESKCSLELREYFGQIPTRKIASYVEHCLNSAFGKSGMVLQDLVNELGRRLEYDVTNGRYQGTVNKVGFDGLWRSPEARAIIAEVKTTDAYRIALDTIAGYRDALIANGTVAPNQSSILIVVGREDTGELEAQVRGSRHAWDIRLISVEALLKVVQLKENSDSTETVRKIRNLLTPVEYTRLDGMVDVMFTTAKDIEAATPEVVDDTDASATASEAGSSNRKTASGEWQFTDSALLQQKREQIMAALGKKEDTRLISKSRALYWNNPTRDVRAACAISKRYDNPNQNLYWYAFHPQWEDFLADAQRSYFVLGCMDLDQAFVIPHGELKGVLHHLNTTTRNGSTYWHIHVKQQSGQLELVLPNTSERFPLGRFSMPLG